MTVPATVETTVETLIAAYGGDHRAAVAALLEENRRLALYVERNVSFGYSRGGRAQVARSAL